MTEFTVTVVVLTAVVVIVGPDCVTVDVTVCEGFTVVVVRLVTMVGVILKVVVRMEVSVDVTVGVMV